MYVNKMCSAKVYEKIATHLVHKKSKQLRENINNSIKDRNSEVSKRGIFIIKLKSSLDSRYNYNKTEVLFLFYSGFGF